MNTRFYANFYIKDFIYLCQHTDQRITHLTDWDQLHRPLRQMLHWRACLGCHSLQYLCVMATFSLHAPSICNRTCHTPVRWRSWQRRWSQMSDYQMGSRRQRQYHRCRMMRRENSLTTACQWTADRRRGRLTADGVLLVGVIKRHVNRLTMRSAAEAVVITVIGQHKGNV